MWRGGKSASGVSGTSSKSQTGARPMHPAYEIANWRIAPYTPHSTPGIPHQCETATWCILPTLNPTYEISKRRAPPHPSSPTYYPDPARSTTLIRRAVLRDTCGRAKMAEEDLELSRLALEPQFGDL